MPQMSVEELSLSLVREFLSRKGLKVTLASMDEELPRSEESISNRLALAKAVGIEKLMKRNKEQTTPYRTMIEVIVKGLLTPSSNSTSHSLPVSWQTKTKEGSASEHQPTSDSTTQSTAFTTPRHDITTRTTGTIQQTKLDKPVLSDYGKPITSSPARRYQTDSNDLLTSGGLLSNDKGNPLQIEDLSINEGSSTASLSYKQNEKRSSKKQSMPKRTQPVLKSGTLIQATETGGFTKGGQKSTAKKFKPRSLAEFEAKERTTNELLDSPKDPAEMSFSVRHSTLYPPAAVASKRDAALQNSEQELIHRIRELQGGGIIEGLRELPADDGRERSRGAVMQSQGSKVVTSKQSAVSGRSLSSSEMTGKSSKVNTNSASLLLFEDLEDVEFNIGDGLPLHGPPPSNQMPAFPRGQPISLETAKALRQLLFGTSKGPSFNAEWRKQNFLFCDLPGLEYGLVQHKGGPCGVLACVQAYILKHLMFTCSQKELGGSPQPSPEERQAGLVSALGDILWKAGGARKTTVALLSCAGTSAVKTTPSYQPDHITERLIQHEFTDKVLMEKFLEANIRQLQDDGSSGCIQFLLSVILTKGVDDIRSDMDERNGRLIGAHGYCTQEMVNLLLTGVATSNVFDGEMNLDYSGKDKMLLRGIPSQSEVGFLSLFEHYGSCTVGGHYKEPFYPIWVVCSESHFTVLFSHQLTLLTAWRLERKFDLYYYDGLANQDEAIRLTIDNTINTSKMEDCQSADDALVPPLESCIRTKWKSAIVTWNGTEPIL